MALRIREAARTVGLTADTLRYYEKINLVPRPARGVGGQRTYGEKDLARLRFVTRAQALEQMHRELTLLVDLCTGASDHCPILDRLDSG